MMYVHSTDSMRHYVPNTGLQIVEMQITNDQERISNMSGLHWF
jgi:hypothetical protein